MPCRESVLILLDFCIQNTVQVYSFHTVVYRGADNFSPGYAITQADIPVEAPRALISIVRNQLQHNCDVRNVTLSSVLKVNQTTDLSLMPKANWVFPYSVLKLELNWFPGGLNYGKKVAAFPFTIINTTFVIKSAQLELELWVTCQVITVCIASKICHHDIMVFSIFSNFQSNVFFFLFLVKATPNTSQFY